MRAFPIIPTWIMLGICILLIIFIFKTSKRVKHMIMVILLFLINQRYMIPTNNTTTTTNNIDVLFVIDNTISMNALDYYENERRMDGVKKDCLKIIEELNGARFGIITFDNKSRILIPFTQDISMVKDSIEVIDPIGEWYARGSSLNTPLEDIERVLKTKTKDRIKVLFFISDGEITDNSTLKSYESIKKYIQEGAVLGYGTTEGSIMYYTDKTSSLKEKQEVLMDKSTNPYKKAISKIDEKNLKKIAEDMKIDYIHMDKEENIDKKIQKIKSLMKEESKVISIASYDDTYYLLTPFILLLLVLECKKARRECS